MDSHDSQQQSKRNIGKRKLLCIEESYINRKNSITLGKAKDSVCHKMECKNTDVESIASERCYQIKENIKDSEDVTKNDDIRIQHHMKSRKLLQKKNMVKCRCKEFNANDNIYEDEEYEKLSKKRNQNFHENYNYDRELEVTTENYDSYDDDYMLSNSKISKKENKNRENDNAAQDYDYYYNQKEEIQNPGKSCI